MKRQANTQKPKVTKRRRTRADSPPPISLEAEYSVPFSLPQAPIVDPMGQESRFLPLGENGVSKEQFLSLFDDIAPGSPRAPWFLDGEITPLSLRSSMANEVAAGSPSVSVDGEPIAHENNKLEYLSWLSSPSTTEPSSFLKSLDGNTESIDTSAWGRAVEPLRLSGFENIEMAESDESMAVDDKTRVPRLLSPMLKSRELTACSRIISDTGTVIAPWLPPENSQLAQLLHPAPAGINPLLPEQPLQKELAQRSEGAEISKSSPFAYRQYLKYFLLQELLKALKTKPLEHTSDEDKKYFEFVNHLQSALVEFGEFRQSRERDTQKKETLRLEGWLPIEYKVVGIFVSILSCKNRPTRPDWMKIFIQNFIKFLERPAKKNLGNTFSSFGERFPKSTFTGLVIEPPQGLLKYSAETNFDEECKSLNPTDLDNELKSHEIYAHASKGKFYQYLREKYKPIKITPEKTVSVPSRDSFASQIHISLGSLPAPGFSFFSHSWERSTTSVLPAAGNLGTPLGRK